MRTGKGRSLAGVAAMLMALALVGAAGCGPGPSSPAGGSTLTGAPVARDDAEQEVLAWLERMDGERRGMMNVSLEDGRLLRVLVESIDAQNVIEIGTSNGYSGIWIGLGLRATGGRLTTYEIDAGRAQLARDNFAGSGIAPLVTLIEGDAHEEVLKLRDPIDLLFLDADKNGYLDYLQKLKPLVRPGGLIVAHNMRMPAPDPRFVEAVTSDPELETVFLRMEGAGMGVALKKR